MTSKLLKEHPNYLRLLLTTPNKTQAVALLDTATEGQLDLLSEIAHNLLALTLPPSLAKRITEGKQMLLKKIADKSQSKRRRLATVSKHCKQLLGCKQLEVVKSDLIRATSTGPR